MKKKNHSKLVLRHEAIRMLNVELLRELVSGVLEADDPKATDKPGGTCLPSG